jgi:hypothetical protein
MSLHVNSPTKASARGVVEIPRIFISIPKQYGQCGEWNTRLLKGVANLCALNYYSRHE